MLYSYKFAGFEDATEIAVVITQQTGAVIRNGLECKLNSQIRIEILYGSKVKQSFNQVQLC